jgi:hypothetical protein
VTNQTEPRRITHAPRLAVKAVGNPNLITLDDKQLSEFPGYDAENQRILLGWLGGEARSINVNKRAKVAGDGVEIWRGLKGQFQAVPLDTRFHITASGILYLPDAMMGIFESYFDADEDGKSRADVTALRFSFAVYAGKATNPRGYEWLFEKEGEVEEVAPALAHMQHLIGGKAPKRLTAPAPLPRHDPETGEIFEDDDDDASAVKAMAESAERVKATRKAARK